MGRPLPRSLWLLSWVSFFADVSSEMVYPLLPLFLVSALHSTHAELGLIEGAAVVLVSAMSALSGLRSDAGQRRVPWIRVGYGLPVLGKALIALATGPWGVLAGRLLDRFGKGLRGPPRDALISAVVPDDQRGEAYGLHRAFDTAGALVGVLLSGALVAWLSAGSSAEEWVYRAVFGVASALGLVSFGVTLAVQEAPGGEAKVKPTTDEPLPRRYWVVLATLVVFAFANSSDMFLLLRAGELGLGPPQVVLAYALYNVVYAGLSYPIGWLSDRVGRWGLIGAGWLVYAAVYAGFAWGTASWVWPLMAVYGLYSALTDGVGKALLADSAPAGRRGAAMGLFQATSGLATLAGSLVVGALWDALGATIAFEVGAVAAVVALGLAAAGYAVARSDDALG